MKAVVRRVGRVAAGIVPAAALARLALPILGAVVFLAILVAAVACWVINNDARADRATRILSAWHDGIRFPEPGAPVISPPGSRRHPRRER